MVPDDREQTAYVLEIVLTGSKPRIWRRFCVPGEITLDRLHDVIQIVMGWQEMHYHCFQIDGQRYTEAPEDPENEGSEEADFRLCDLVAKPKAKFGYEYDFGDSWHHTLTVESINSVPNDHHPIVSCMDGKRSCPPEDVGGIDGYSEFLAALKDRDHPEHESYREWCGGEFNASGLDLDAINLELAKYARWSRPRSMNLKLIVQGISSA